MGVENLEAFGYSPKDAPVDKECNPSHQSMVVGLGKNVLICREVGTGSLGLNFEEEVKRRKSAVDLHCEILPKYTLKNSFALLQGEKDGQKVPVLARLTEALTSVKPVSELGLYELVGDKQVCHSLFDINFSFLKALFTKKIIPDAGPNGNAGLRLPMGLSTFTSRLAPGNVMVGYDKNGNRKCFVDPDWYITFKEYEKIFGVLGIAKRIYIHTQNILFFGTLSVLHETRDRLNEVNEHRKQIKALQKML